MTIYHQAMRMGVPALEISEDLVDAMEIHEAFEHDGRDYTCAICDDGGYMIVCEGKCMRSFYATTEHGQLSHCYSLGFTDEQSEAMDQPGFFCKNCEYNKHQCFSCGELGSSDDSSGAEVFQCENEACGHFFHADCVAKLLYPEDNAAAEAQSGKIVAGEQFACPVHKCYVCNQVEVSSEKMLQFAVCRRCPRAYHRECLPREIASSEDISEGRATRAFEGLIPNRVVIYCLDHDISENSVGKHIKFPDPSQC